MSDTQIIKEKLDIVDFINEYVQLKPAGINHKGLCPFHGEKTPSFMVNRDRQSWHCFGCAKGGDIFSFVQLIEGMEFVEALKFLAARAGVELEVSAKSQVEQSQKNRLKEINQEAARFFYKFLEQMDAAGDARAYVKNRGLEQKTIDEWFIGFVPEQWELLTKYLIKKGFGIDDLVASGLTIRKEGAQNNSARGFYDRFRGRIMFPIRDVHGFVVGFTGRLLSEDSQQGGKYVNSPQTVIYDKSRILFGLDKAKQSIREHDYVVLVEGQMDVISSHQAGITHVVATSGTALTLEQIKLLQRYTKNVRMAFDTDDAGIAAAKRGIDLALEAGLSVKVIAVPGGKDPDECVRENRQAWHDAVENARDVMEWYFDRVLTGNYKADPRKKQEVADQLLGEIIRIPYAVERDHWLQQLAIRIGVSMDVLRDDARRLQEAGRKKNPAHQHSSSAESSAKPSVKKKTRLDTLIEHFLALYIKYPEHVDRELKDETLDRALSTYAEPSLYETLKREYTANASFDFEALRSKYSYLDAAQNPIDVLLFKGESIFLNMSEAELEREARTTSQNIKNEWVRVQRQSIAQQISEAEHKHDEERLRQLLEEFNSLPR